MLAKGNDYVPGGNIWRLDFVLRALASVFQSYVSFSRYSPKKAGNERAAEHVDFGGIREWFLMHSRRWTPCTVRLIIEDVIELGFAFHTLFFFFNSDIPLSRYSPTKTPKVWESCGLFREPSWSSNGFVADFDVLSSANALRRGLDIWGRHRACCHLSCAVFLFTIGSFFLEIFAEGNARDLSSRECFEFRGILGG